MNRTLLILPFAAAAALAGCSNESHTIVAGSKEDKPTVNAAEVVLPPAIEASKSYRCKDNSLVYVDWLNDKKNADIKAERTGPATRVTVAEAGKPYTAAGYSLTGTSADSTVTIERPGKGSQSCKA